jgi:hypothetical protein
LSGTMDLTEICLRQALVDQDIANHRILMLSVRLAEAGRELSQLREQLEGLDISQSSATSPVKRVADGTGPKRVKAVLLSALAIKPKFHVDSVNGRSFGAEPIVIQRSQVDRLRISGWAVPSLSSDPFDVVEISLIGHGSRVTSSTKTEPRSDVAKHFGTSTFTMSGFRAEILLGGLDAGRYKMVLLGQSESGLRERASAGVVDLI